MSGRFFFTYFLHLDFSVQVCICYSRMESHQHNKRRIEKKNDRKKSPCFVASLWNTRSSTEAGSPSGYANSLTLWICSQRTCYFSSYQKSPSCFGSEKMVRTGLDPSEDLISVMAETAKLKPGHKVPHMGLVSGDSDSHTSGCIQLRGEEEKGLSKQQQRWCRQQQQQHWLPGLPPVATYFVVATDTSQICPSLPQTPW